MTHSNKFVITGIGIVSPLGNDTQSTWKNLLLGKSGISQLQSFDASEFPTHIAAEVKQFNIKEYLPDHKFLRQSTNFVRFAFAAATQAFADAGIRPTDQNAERWGCVVGSGMMTAEFDYWQRFQQRFAEDGSVNTRLMDNSARDFLNVREFAKTLSNSGLSLLLQQFNIRGYTNSVHTACASGGQALGLALQALRRGDADRMLVGGFDSMINPIGVASFCLLGALSTYNDTPETASRPFDLTRNGFVLGEGAAFLIVENYQRAQQRGATIYAELAGEGNSLSAYRITDSHPSGDGAIQALQSALQDANVEPQHVDYINAHGTSTKMNDLSESNAIQAVFGSRAKSIAVSSTKSQTGHLIAAAGSIEAAFSALAIYHSKIPATRNLTTPDPECDLDFVREGVRDRAIRVALSDSFGFGGSNSCVVFKHPEWQGE
ncbi:MAG: beta-ketoacyl-[acyl-carrier-protein] synthase family protein [Legionellales bacterium]|nr:beta-ketoacyl-[acyl-carrier-protein] synthase family protein [Legionellales bacterium]